MYLKALTLKGFKSFAENTNLNFEPGVTVVVGPNGSGKSNLVDAVAWVLGAQGARALRGAKMDDVIFAGTTKKAALGRAEVSLTIDNSDQTLPIEFSEVTITRTLFRSGESEYRLNDVPCRLLDIQELLSDSRIGRTQHVIVGQGQLDSVLNARPEDRRAIIEEAAGVLKYRKRREKSQRRLEATEGNLTRLTDLVREVRRQLSPLQRQADAARRHDDVRDELNSIKLFLAGKEIKGLQLSIERIATESEDQRELENSLVSELSELDISVLDAETALMRVGDSDVSTWLTRAERLVAKTSATKSMLIERKRSINSLLDSSADESVIESLLKEKEELEQIITELTNSENVLVPTLSSLRSDLEQFKIRYEDFVKDAPTTDIIRDYDALVKEQKLHEGNLSVLRDRLDTDIARLATIRQRISVLTQDNKDAQDVLESETVMLDEMNSEHKIVLTNLAGLRQELDSKEQEHRDAQKESAKLKAHYEVMLETFQVENQNTGIEKVRNHNGVLGTLLENISINDRYSDAVSVALQDLANSIVVDSAESARDLVSALNTSEYSARLFLLGQNVLRQPSEIPNGTISITQCFTSSNAQLMQTLESMLSNVVVVDQDWKIACNIAINNPEMTVITTKGDCFSSSGWALGKTSIRAVTKEQVERAQLDAQNAGRLLADIESRLKELIIRRDEIGARERDLASSINEITSRSSIAKQTVHTTSSGIEARKVEVTQLDREIQELRELISVEESTIDELHSRAAVMRDQKDNIEARTAEYETRLHEHQVTRDSLENEIRRIEIEQERTQTRLKDATNRLSIIVGRLAKDPEQEQAAQQRRAQHLSSIEKIEELISRTDSVENASLTARDMLSQERDRQTEKAHESTSRLETLRSQRRQAENNLTNTRALLQKGEISLAETKTKLTSTIEILRANFDCEPQSAIQAEQPIVPEGNTLTQRARELERDLKTMGPINPLAVQEYDELNERHVFLNQQLDDVKASRKELHKVIKTIDQEIVTVFEKAFEDVQKHFSDLFSTLFAGGAGRLTLCDPTDMLNTGIEMEARPSGKNVRRLSLLSGGERSLTALAFLFAVFRSRPSPFYIMDEVEAALDEPNLMRFLDLVAEFREDAQLLIVSHQKKTMEAADELYGVTMAPGGSSRTIKQRIEKHHQNAEDETGESVIDLVSLENEEETQEDRILESTI